MVYFLPCSPAKVAPAKKSLLFCTNAFCNNLPGRKQQQVRRPAKPDALLAFGEDYYAAAEALLRLLDRYWKATMAPTSTRPARSVTVPGIIMPRPPTTSRIRRGQATFLYRWPLSAAAMPKIPSSALMQICATSHQPEMFSKSSAGL